MSGKIIAGVIVLVSLIGGAAIYYLQVYAYYETLGPSEAEDVQLVSLVSGEPEGILYENFEAITSDSSPIRYRACFTTEQSIAFLSETYEPYEEAEPLVGPDWFECFDAREIGQALEAGEAVPFLSQSNIVYGIDRVAAVLPDGRGFVWHQINECGEVVFDGRPAPEGCPTPPEN